MTDLTQSPLNRSLHALPGLVLTALLSGLGFAVWIAAGRPAMLSPMIVALVAGIVIGNLGWAVPSLKPGTALAMRPVLRTGIVLLGFRLTLGDLGQLGIEGLAMVIAVVLTSFLVIRRLGRMLGVSDSLSELIAAGTSICGASAVLGMNAVTRARDAEVAYAIACVTIFGTVSMVLFPALMPVLALSDHAFGLWAGVSIHEVAQAVGAGWSVGDMAGETATITKLCRVLMLAPMILLAGLSRRDTVRSGSLPVPLFVLGFLAAIVVNTLAEIPKGVTAMLTMISTFLLAMALAGMGLETRLTALRAEGPRPLLLGAIGWVFISAAGAALVLMSA